MNAVIIHTLHMLDLLAFTVAYTYLAISRSESKLGVGQPNICTSMSTESDPKLLLYDNAYLARTRHVDAPLAQTGETSRNLNLWVVDSSPEFGRYVLDRTSPKFLF